MMIMAVALSVSMLAVIGGQTQANAAGSLAEPCVPAAPAAGTTSPTPSPSTSAGPIGTVVGQIVDFFGRLLNGASATPAPTATPTGSPVPSPPPTSCPSPGPVPSRSRPATKPSGKPTASPAPKILRPAAGQPDVVKRPSRMTGSRVTMIDLFFEGIVELPQAGGGRIRVLKFTMTQSDTNDFLLHVYGRDGYDIDLRSSKLTVRGGGGVQFFTSRFQGNLGGLIPVDYTPDNPPPFLPLPLPLPVSFTDPVVQLVWVDSPVLDAPDLRISLVPSK
jgi:hypothetical protein